MRDSKWDKYFYRMAKAVEENSKCLSRKIGAVLVRDKSVISTGYNGPARGIPECNERLVCKSPDLKLAQEFHKKYGKNNFELDKCPRKLLGYPSGEGAEFCIAGHAERNALINAARNGINTYGTSLYLSCGVPCKDCLVEIINAGVAEVVVTDKDEFYDETSKYILKNSNITIRNYSFGE